MLDLTPVIGVAGHLSSGFLRALAGTETTCAASTQHEGESQETDLGQSGGVMDLVETLDVCIGARTPGDVRRPVRWVRLSLLVVAIALVASVLGYLIHDEAVEHRQYTRLHTSLKTTRQRSERQADDLAELTHDVAVLAASLKNDSATWQHDEAQLKAAAAALAVTQADVSQQGSRITALHACLGGVQQALNALAVNNQASAVSDLTSVGSSCAAASGG